MKKFSDKIGKVGIIIRRDGFLKGVGNLLGSFFRSLRPVKDGDVLFVTGGLGIGSSAFYRCHNQAEELSKNGIKTEVVIQDRPDLLSLSKKFRFFVFHRPAYNERLKRFINLIKEQKKEIIFETDDLLFDPGYLEKSEHFKNAPKALKEIFQSGIGTELVKDPDVKTAVTSTTFLAEKLRETGKKVFVSSNKLSDSEVALADELLRGKSSLEGELRLGYFSGTSGHDRDFAEITGALLGVMERYPEARLHIAGPLSLDKRLEKFSGRIVRLPFVSRKKHFENISRIDINLAPLESGNDFCEAKSELKFFEAGILGIPTVASGTQTFREAIRDGEDGFVASSVEEWEEKLARLIADAELRKTMGEKARATALERFTTRNAKNEEYYDYLRSHIA